MMKILLISTGGTIASSKHKNGLAPSLRADDLAAYAANMSAQISVETLELMCLDSSNIQPEDWVKIARTVYDNYRRYDGFVITHGTDTMAYTASMLGFMLGNVNKPVVLTGSQIPIEDDESDAPANLNAALMTAAAGVCGISVVFDGRIINGCRAVKVHSFRRAAFDSVNVPLKGEVKNGAVTVYDTAARYCEPRLLTDYSDSVALIKITPGMPCAVMDSLNVRGAVVELYGTGGLSVIGRNHLGAVERMIRRGTIVAVCSQCLYGGVDLGIYEVGAQLRSIGVIECKGMTSEAAVTKMMWSLGQSDNMEEVKNIFTADICGEM